MKCETSSAIDQLAEGFLQYSGWSVGDIGDILQSEGYKLVACLSERKFTGDVLYSDGLIAQLAPVSRGS